jgi:hypothetical protein
MQRPGLRWKNLGIEWGVKERERGVPGLSVAKKSFKKKILDFRPLGERLVFGRYQRERWGPRCG